MTVRGGAAFCLAAALMPMSCSRPATSVGAEKPIAGQRVGSAVPVDNSRRFDELLSEATRLEDQGLFDQVIDKHLEILRFRPREVRLGRARFALAALVWSYIALTAIAPVLVIVVASLSTYAWSGIFTWANLTHLWTANDVRGALVNTLTITLVAATLATIIGFGVSWVTMRTTLRGRRLLDYLVLFPIAVPSLAFAIGVAFFWLRVPWPIYGTMWVIVLGFLGRYTSYAVRSITGSLVQIHPELEESARVCGYGWFRTVGGITLPLIWPAVVSGWVMLYSIFMTELSIVLPLYTAETRTLSILSFDTWSVGRFSLVASLSLLQLVIGVGVMYAVTAATRRREAAL